MPATVVIKYVVDDSQLNKARESSVRAQKATDDLRKSTQSYGKEVKSAGDSGQKAFNQISTAIKSVSLVLLAKELLDFTKQVITVRGEFQKFEAVLTNTLGSRSAALIALGRINEFAKSTPFGVKELTDNFIKLANRGIQPTVQQMRAIADLSATLGKDFSQVVEAILDINNPERWKEIGIKAETAGNKVKLTFRGVTEEVDRTVEGVTNAVVALGKLNGVAGSTEAISRTLSGQTSNLSDAWEQLLNTIGKGNEGVLFDAVSMLSQALEKANQLIKSDVQIFDELLSKTLAAETEDFQRLVSAFGGDVDKARAAFDKKVDDRIVQLNERFKRVRDSMETSLVGDVGVSDRNRIRQAEMDQLSGLVRIYMEDLPSAIDETIKKLDVVTPKFSVNVHPRFSGELTHEQYLKLKHDLEKLSEDDPANIKVTISDSDMKKIQQDAFDFMSKELASDNGDSLSFGDILFGTGDKDENSIIKAWNKQWKEFLVQGIDDTNSFLIGIQDAETESYRNRLSNLRNFYDEQQLLAGDNERAKKELRLQEERETARLQSEIALREWKAKRNSIILSTAGGIARAFIDYQWPYALIPAAAVALQGGAQLAVADKNKPRFAKGVIDLKGPGSDTSDSIDAKLSRGESVMTAKETREAFGILTDIRAGKLNDKVLKQIVLNGGSQVFDDSRIIDAIQSQPKPPDLVQQGRQIIEVYKGRDGSKKFIRSKSI